MALFPQVPGAIAIYRGCDAADVNGMARNAAKVRAAGFDFVMTYLKWTTKVHVAAFHDAGLGIGLIFERAAGSALSGSGVADGVLARRQAAALGAPSTVPIFATVDSPVGYGTDLDKDKKPDLDEVQEYLTTFGTDAAYVDGDIAKVAGLKHIWLAGAMGWPGSRDFYNLGSWDIVQGVPTRGGSQFGVDWPDLGFEYDPDVARILDWMWAAPNQSSRVPAEVLTPIPAAREMQATLAAAGLYKGRLDGDWGPLSQKALADYYAKG